MENVLSLAFRAWLLLKITWSLWRMFYLVLLGAIFIASPILAVGIWLSIILFLIWGKPVLQTHFSSQKTPQAIEKPQQNSLDQQIQFWESIHQKQPTDRDVLINLAHLYTAQGNTGLAKTYTQQAHEIDPNFSF